ncbi:patatin-like phospholipase family protein [Oceanobacillus rekensis]|uniref:patatin-like phospholipase family protein n=1 Tax=Oceanobacillus rekensis TaxID=937927 RepID=UPI001FE3D8F4|nr:patatin family protein [Oceanobacillus rekensis]
MNRNTTDILLLYIVREVYELEGNTGLLLEGGGMRVAYTAGVLDLFLDKGIEFPVVATASAGALIGSSYITKQRERNYQMLAEIGGNPKSISFKRMIQDRELYSMDYIFNQLPNEIAPLDFEAFSQSTTNFIIGTTDIDTGYPIYHDTYDTKEDLFKIIRASCSLPLLASSVSYQDLDLMDGGVSDPIPIKPLIDKGMKKHVVILTRNKGYIKKGTKLNWLFKRIFHNKPQLQKLLQNRHLMYNQTMQKLLNMEKCNEVFIIQPEVPLAATRIERNRERLENLYVQGYKEAEMKSEALKHFLQNNDIPSADLLTSITS